MSKILFFSILIASLMTATSLFAQEEDVFYHTVERGQTVYSIAKMYDVKVEDIYRLNINSEESIKAGSQLRIPQKKAAIKAEVEGVYLFHTIQAKETLYGVSQKYSVSAESIIEANPGLSNLSFATGKIIRIPSNVKPKQTTEIVETRRGVKEVYYTILEKETVYNLCKRFKTTEQELLKLNPELAGGLRKGMTIRIPLRINEDDVSREDELDAGEVNAMLDARTAAKPVKAARIALLLPYNATNPKVIAGGSSITEYYEGMLLAADSLRRMGYVTELFVFDIGDRKEDLQKILDEDADVLESVSLIIGGVSNEQIRLISDFALKYKKKYVIPITSKNDEVLTNAYVFQVNTPQTYLCDNAAFAAANLFDKYNIVFIDTKDKDEQTDFINTFKKELRGRTTSFRDFTYNEDTFESKIIADLSADKPNLIIPLSNTEEALNKITTVLRSITNTKPEYKITLLGYPVWQSYNKCLDDYHALDTYIYSLFYADNLNPDVKAFYDTYRNWYSKSPSQKPFPKYSMLGFDTGMYFFGSLQKHGENFETELPATKHKSLQIGFNFERVNNWGGFINTNIYIVHYNKDFTITRSDFK